MNNHYKSWFEKLMGFQEENPNQVRENIQIKGNKLESLINGTTIQFGDLETPSLDDLQNRCFNAIEDTTSGLSVTELVGNIQSFHKDVENTDALFQAASQFNLLEMVGPHITPEKGVGIYERDYTQGPACAIACGAGTIYRNYFVHVNEQIGQSANNQIDCLSEIGQVLNNEELLLWDMTNGYALPSKLGLEAVSDQIKSLEPDAYEELKGKLKIGIQWNTEVTISETRHLVSQAYCSALPVAYSYLESSLWEPFAQLVLEATYEATLYAALINFKQTGCNKVFLTLVGGGAFGNKSRWIKKAVLQALMKFKNTPLDVKIVSFGSSNETTQEIIHEFWKPTQKYE